MNPTERMQQAKKEYIDSGYAGKSIWIIKGLKIAYEDGLEFLVNKHHDTCDKMIERIAQLKEAIKMAEEVL